MGLVPLTNKQGIKMHSTAVHLTSSSSSTAIIDATGESVTFIGKVFLEAGSGSKVLSGAGSGKIRWTSGGTITFANAGTTLRIGVQDVASTGLEDGTFDVYKDLVGGTDTITAGSTQLTTMANGSKTINHRDLIAISFEAISRAGADSIGITSRATQIVGQASSYFPYRTDDSGSGPTRSGTAALGGAMIEFDDGTLGWFEPYYLIPSLAAPSNQTYNQTSSPDEYAAIFKVPFKCTINATMFSIGAVASTDTFECVVYTDPLGTPAVQQTVTVDPNVIGSTSSTAAPYWIMLTALTLSPDVWYGIAIRPTSNNSINVAYHDMGSGNSKYKRPCDFGENIQWAGRTNQSGAFVETQTYHLPVFAIQISELDDGKTVLPKQQIVGAASTY